MLHHTMDLLYNNCNILHTVYLKILGNFLSLMHFLSHSFINAYVLYSCVKDCTCVQLWIVLNFLLETIWLYLRL